jgi:hypothetical protein
VIPAKGNDITDREQNNPSSKRARGDTSEEAEIGLNSSMMLDL